MNLAIILSILAIACLSMAAVTPGIRDALVKATRALPASTTAVTSTVIDTGTNPTGAHLAMVEYLLTAPALSAGQLPDTKTMTYAIIHSANADLSSPAVLIPAAIVQTGSTGAATASYRLRLPSDARRYIGFTVTPSASGTGDASAATATLEGQF